MGKDERISQKTLIVLEVPKNAQELKEILLTAMAIQLIRRLTK